jgi:PAS domain S-box-containing protein
MNLSRFAPKTIGSRLVLAIGLASALVIGSISLTAYQTGSTSLTAQANADAFTEVRTAATAVDEAINRLAYVPRMLAAYQAGVGREPDPNLEFVIRNLLHRIPAREIFGTYVAFDAKNPYDRHGMIWMDRGSWPVLRRVDYDFHQPDQHWYAGPKNTRRLHLSEPFFDRGGSPLAMVSLTFPVVLNGEFIGVTGVDLPLTDIASLLKTIHDRASSGRREGAGRDFVYLASPTGQLLVHPNASLLLREDFAGTKLAALPKGDHLAREREGSAPYHGADGDRILYWTVAPVTGWKVVLDQPASIVMAPIHALAWRTTIIGGGGLIVLLALVGLISRRATRPVVKLERAAKALETGSFVSAELDPLVTRADESGRLARAFQNMAREIQAREERLAEWNHNLERTVQERTAALGAAEAESRKLALVASRTYNGVIITDAAGLIEWTNDAFTRITGYTAEEAIGRTPDALLSGPATAPAVREEQAAARRENRGFQIEVLNYRKDGTPFWVLADGQPVFDAAGRMINYLVVQVDISKRKQTEEELLIASAAAQEASRTKSAFLANMSHELRTPMNAIIGYSEMLVEEAEDSGQEEFIPDLKKIHTAGKHLLSLINDVLDLSKIEAGKMTLYLEDFALPAMIAEVTSTIQPLIEKNTNQLVVECPMDLGTMHADVTKVRQTLFNLLSNAAKFTQQGRITLTVGRERGDGVELIAFRVADTGIGMTPQQLGKLFNAFVQADASTTRKYGGTGLGLAISRKFCQMMGGDITVTSEEGRGTVFTALVPQYVSDVSAGTHAPFAMGARPAAAPSAMASVPAQVEGPLILAVDDDPTVLDILSRTFAREGYSVRTATTGAEALALARELRPKLITLDVMMPSMDGWSVLTSLKADPITRAIPVVMISLVDDKQLGFALGAADYLTKPIDRDRLAELLTKHAPHGRERLALVIDDLPDNRAMLRHALEREGWLVVEAENGRAGLSLFADQKPSLILLDLMMPVMDGFEFLRELRARGDGRAVPVVVVTAKELTPDERNLLRAGVENIVQKGTVSHDSLLAEIREKIARAANVPEPRP